MKRKILISGGTGLIGNSLTSALIDRGYEVSYLSRETKTGAIPSFKWNLHENYIDENAFEGVTDVVHLAGAGLADKRWTKERKEEIIFSRIKGTELIYSVIEKLNLKLNTFCGANAIGYYGAVTSDKIFNEYDPPANDFLGTCCRLWEDSYNPVIESGIRTCIIRTAPVISGKGGFLPKLADPIVKGIGAPLGSGKQYMPWIHIDDITGIYLKAIEEESMSGIYNAVATEHCTNEEMMKAVAAQLGKKLLPVNVPAFVMKIVLGELAVAVLEGSRVDNQKIKQAGYTFKFPALKQAIADQLGGIKSQ